MFLRKGFNGKFIICAMIASLLSVHVAYAADPVDAIEINESGNCVAENVENAKYVHWDSGTNTCIVDTCADEYTLHENKCIKACDREVLAAKYATDGYLQEDKCIITVCADGYDLDTQNNLCKSRESGGGSGTTVTADCGKNLFNPQLMTEGGFTYTSSNYLFKGKFSRAYNALNHTYSGDFLSNYYMSKYSYGLQKDTKYKLTYQIKCDENDIGNMYIGMMLKNGGTEAKEIPNNVCSGNTGLQTVTLRGGGNGTDVIGVFLGRLGDTDYTGDVEISNVMLVLDDEDTSRMIPYGPCIKISTKMATATRATGVEERLSNVRSIISDLITRTQENADGINGLQSSKQTRPVDSNACPSNKTCLLVKDTAGHNNWYEIMTCGLDAFLGNPGTFSGDTECDSASAETTGCTVGEWVSYASGGAVFGESKAVSIVPRASGSIVTLPNNITATGDTNVCVCKITGYSELDGQTYGTRQNVTTDKWFVAGDTFINHTDSGCAVACARAGTTALSYYTNVANTCTGGATQARTCDFNWFFAGLYNGSDSIHLGGHPGTNVYGGDPYDRCTSDQFSGTVACQVSATNPGAWMSYVYDNSGSVGSSYSSAVVYGKARCVADGTVFDNASDYDVLELTAAQSVASNSGSVCIHNVTGYKTNGGDFTAVSARAQNVWMVKKYADAETCQNSCYGTSWLGSNGALVTNYELYGKVGDSCLQ